MKKKLFSISGIIVGIVICILGIILPNDYHGHYPDIYNVYGADFYTDIYKTTAYAAANIEEIGHILFRAFSHLLIAIGLTDICYFGNKLINHRAEAPDIITPSPVAEHYPEELDHIDAETENEEAPME